MAFLPTGLGEELWRPKRTLRDWGKTEYRIIKNWTPREQREAQERQQTEQSVGGNDNSSDWEPDQHPQHEGGPEDPEEVLVSIHSEQRTFHSQHYGSVQHNGAERGGTLSTSDQSVQRSGGERGSTLSTSDRGSVRRSGGKRGSTLSTSDRGSVRRSGGKRGSTLSTSDRGSVRRSGAERGGTLSTSDRGSVRRSGAERGGTLSTSDQSVRRSGGKRGGTLSTSDRGSVQRSGVERGGTLSTSDHHSVQAERGDSLTIDMHSQSHSEEEPHLSMEEDVAVEGTTSHTQGSRGSGRKVKPGRKKQSQSSVRTRLWQPRNVTRTARDLHELDICLTVYDEALREALEVAESDGVERVLATHWKHTQKHMLAVIRDVHTAIALEKRMRKEKMRQRKLGQEMLTTVQALRRTSGDYNMALVKAKQFKKATEMSNDLDEIQRLTDEIHERRKQ